MEESLLNDHEKGPPQELMEPKERDFELGNIEQDGDELEPLTDEGFIVDAEYNNAGYKRGRSRMSLCRSVFDCGIWFFFTLIFLILMVLLFAVAHPKTSLLLLCALIPGLLFMSFFNVTHFFTGTSSELHWEMFWSGALSILVALVGEIAMNGAITALLRVIAPSQYKSVVEKKQGHWEVVTVMPPTMKLFYFFLNAFFIAGLVEEACKLGLVYRIQKRLRTPLGCVIYGICGALGFATVENVKYVIVAGIKAQYNPMIVNSNLHSYFAEVLRNNPYLYGIIVAFERGFTSVPGHSLFGALIGLGFARRLIHSDVRSKGIDKLGIKSVSLFSILFPSLFFHGIYDFSLMSAGMLSKGVVRTILISFAHSIVFIVLCLVIVTFIIIHRKFKRCNENSNGQSKALLEEEYEELSLS